MAIAFDYLDISILLDKLNYYGIRGVGQTWVADYLYGRSQKVSSGNTSASTLYLKHGAPPPNVLQWNLVYRATRIIQQKL